MISLTVETPEAINNVENPIMLRTQYQSTFMNHRNTSYTFIFLLLLLISCGEGLAPPEPDLKVGPGLLRGTIIYEGGVQGWENAPDSVVAIRAAGFLSYPLPDSAGIINELLNGRAVISGFTSLPVFVDSSTFEIPIENTPTTLKYFAIAQQTSIDLNDQTIIGVYSNFPDFTPIPITIKSGDTVSIVIKVDFRNRPPQPF
ncbi:MAG: hypothetical protein LW818_09390 [Ignavibacteriae bacterium]|nr:hypothetical protein [Ignavibacteriota bacterium]